MRGELISNLGGEGKKPTREKDLHGTSSIAKESPKYNGRKGKTVPFHAIKEEKEICFYVTTGKKKRRRRKGIKCKKPRWDCLKKACQLGIGGKYRLKRDEGSAQKERKKGNGHSIIGGLALQPQIKKSNRKKFSQELRNVQREKSIRRSFEGSLLSPFWGGCSSERAGGGDCWQLKSAPSAMFAGGEGKRC